MNGRREFNLGEIEEGAYYPGIYIIKMNKEFNKEIRYDDFSDEDWRTFIHEYVHFLQDISTRRGYLYFHHKAQLMNLCLYVLQKSGDEIVELPICLEKTGVVNASEKDTLLAFYEGDNAHKKIHHINQVLLEKDEPITDMVFSNSSEKDDLIMINIYYDDKPTPYQFGNICIVESMAYLIEKNLFGTEERCRELPYNACELVCNEIYPELLEYPNRLLFFASTFWTKLQNIFGHYCKSKLDKVAKPRLAAILPAA